MDAAAKADSALARGAAIGPLHGIPVTIKDLEPVRGMPFEGGTYLRRGDVAAADNVVVVAPAECGRHHPRQDHHARIRLEGRQPQPADRHHAQSVEARPQRRRVFRRRGRWRGGGLRSAASGQRRRGLDPHARAFLRRLRIEADLRTRAAIADGAERLHRASRPVDAHRRRRGPDAQGDGRPSSRRSIEPRSAAGRLSGTACEPAARAAYRVQSGPWPCPRRSRGRRRWCARPRGGL